jgi:hypothetical protein
MPVSAEFALVGSVEVSDASIFFSVEFVHSLLCLLPRFESGFVANAD